LQQAGQLVVDQLTVLKNTAGLVVDVVAQKTDLGLNAIVQGKQTKGKVKQESALYFSEV
jgi:hypothetical protein